MSTTRRITKDELQKIKELQELLENRGIRISQTELSELMTNYVLDNLNEFLKIVEETGDQLSDEDKSFFEFLNKTYRGKKTNSVEEHDVVM